MASTPLYNPLIVKCWLLMLAFSIFNIANTEAKNIKPSAVAGSAQSVLVGSQVILDGKQSSDSDGTITKWRWAQIKGTKVKLLNGTQAQASFTSPMLKAQTKSSTLIFKLTVTDNKKAIGAAKVQITVNALPICRLPEILQNGVCVRPLPVCTDSQILQNGICIKKPIICPTGQILLNGLCITPEPVCRAPLLFKNGFCVSPQPVCDLPLVIKDGVCISPETSGIFNDTGITDCSDGSVNIPACSIAQFPGQDGEFGRDVNNYNDNDGHAGFSFTKISDTGAELPLDAHEWSCVKDNVTGLLWENKTDNGGLHDKNHSYSNYNSGFNPKNEYATATDVTGFVADVNTQGLCGVNHWRLPTNIELQGIIDFSIGLPGPVIDQGFFSNATNDVYWTASPQLKKPNSGWLIYLDDGRIFDDHLDRNASVRLVSGSSPAHSYAISTDGQEVTDNATGLIWQRCVEGMVWDGSACTGLPSSFMFQEALQRVETVNYSSGKHWRMPNVKELASLLDTSINNDVIIDNKVFPGTPNDQYWTSSPYTTDAFFAWVVHFFYGSVYYTYSEDLGVVRLVRDKD